MQLTNLAKQYVQACGDVDGYELTIRRGVLYRLEPLGEVALLNQEARQWERQAERLEKSTSHN